MNRTVLKLIMFALLFSAFLSLAHQLSEAKAAIACEQTGLVSQAASGIEGNWSGALDVGTFKLRLVLKISKSAEGKLTATVDSLDQNAKDLVVDTITFEEGTLKFEMKALGASYVGTLSKDGTQLTGKFTQGGVLPLDFSRVTDVSQMELKRPQTPKKPYPYKEEDVSYENNQDQVKLAATLTLPPGNGPFPAVILITGSGAQDRNESILGHQPFLVLADYLTRRGIAVLRADDRGMGGTSKGGRNDTTENYAGDALAGVEFLKTRKEINAKQIGLIGHSEGGMAAPMAATRSNDVAFIVLMAGPGISGGTLLRKQIGLIAAAECEKEVARAMEEGQQLMTTVLQEKDDAVARQKLHEGAVKRTEAAKKKLDTQLANADAQSIVWATPWFRYFLSYDPRPTLMKVRVPVLAINGEKDLQVPAKEDLEAIDQALKDAGNKDYKIVLLPDLNHLFQTTKTGAPSEYAESEETLAPIALQTIGDWIAAHTTAPSHTN
ncbi:MAG: alpha/beta hydrolase family protein [Pyrinomonadaceae bacterium]